MWQLNKHDRELMIKYEGVIHKEGEDLIGTETTEEQNYNDEIDPGTVKANEVNMQKNFDNLF